MFNILTRLDRSRYTPTMCVAKKGGAIGQELAALNIPVLELPFIVPVQPYATFLPRAATTTRAFHPYGFKLWHSFHHADGYSEPLIAHFSGARAWVYSKKSISWGSRAWLMRSCLATRIVADFHNNLSPSDFIELQRTCRKLWEEYFTLEGFHKGLINKLNGFQGINFTSK